MKKHNSKIRFRWLGSVLLVYLMLGVVVLTERAGIRFDNTARESSYLDPAAVTLEQAAPATDTLLLYDSTQAESNSQLPEWREILNSMDVGYEERDVSKATLAPLDGCKKAIVIFPDLTVIGGEMDVLTQWVKGGGQLLFSATLNACPALQGIAQKIGIYESNYTNVVLDKIWVDGFMVGGNRSYVIPDAYDSSLQAVLSQDCTVHIASDSQYPNPVLWEKAYGTGKFVVVNLGFLEKSVRGIYAAAYSLLGDVCVYPVINSETFYIDDFPAPVPGGDSKYVEKEFSRDTSSFYTNVWWPDMEAFSKKYGVRYTGVLIENYEDQVDPPFVRQSDTDRFAFFGNSILLDGGEIGYHGYNHQPLVLESFDYKGEEDYAKWPSTDAMAQAVSEMRDFAAEVFPTSKLSVYVPPSNILSQEGRQTLLENLPDLCAIASLYFPAGVGYAQEFSVADDGIVEMPRIVSGAELTDYMWLAAFSELNFHYVSSHFIHPDDLLDPDRGAAKGWTYLRGTLEEFISYLGEKAPDLRMQVGSEEAGAVQRYCYAAVSADVTAESVRVSIRNFFGESYCFVRLDAAPGKVTGGTLKQIADGLYLLHATSPEVTIERGTAE
jgi:hypothetical protein